MPNFSILVRLQDATPSMIARLLASLSSQTEPSWELILVTEQTRELDRRLAADAHALHDQVRQLTVPTGTSVHMASNIATGLGTWVGFMGQRDLLVPTALAELQLAIASHPDAKVVFTDEEARNRSGHISMRFTKGAINPTRLRSQEYLRDFTVIARSWLTELGGFNRLASDWPAHDIYLRTLEAQGPIAFANVPQRLYQRFRDHRRNSADVRRRDHMVGYDLWSMREHLKRQNLPATCRQLNGTAEIQFEHPARQAVTLISTLPLEQRFDLEKILRDTTHKPMTVHHMPDASIAELNTAVLHCNTPLICFLNAMPVNPEWLATLVDHVMVPGTGAIGARLMTPIQLTQPGLLNYRFEGWDWNSRGRFNELAVPHQVSAVSPHCMLIDVQRFLTAGGFNPAYPRLYGMDLCLRLDRDGFANLQVPGAQALVGDVELPDPVEAFSFRNAWPGWSCRFGLHLPE